MAFFRNAFARHARARLCSVIIIVAATVGLNAPAIGATLSLSPGSLPNGTQGVAYDQTVSASGGNGDYSYSITSGSLPTGISLNGSTGELTGTPGTTGVWNFTIQAQDTGGNSGTRAYSIAVGTASLTLLPTTLPAVTEGTSYSQTITAEGGTAPYTFSVSSGSLPSGLTLSSAGLLSGTPSVNGSYGFILQATDVNGNTGYRTYSLNIGTNSLSLTPTTLPNGTQGTPYNQTVTASGGTGPYTYSVSSGSLPAGLSLNANSGAITGTPSGSGVSNFTISAADGYGDAGSQNYSVAIGSNSLTLNPTSLPDGTQGTPYNQTVTASGGTGPYTYAVTSGALPAGLSLNTSSGAITGTPSGTGLSNFTITATDSLSDTGSRSYSVNIGTNSLTLNPTSLPDGTQGTPYSQSVTASGGTAPYTYAVTLGALPAGLSLNTNSGAITGTPTGSGTSNFTIQATDANANTGSRSYSVDITLAPLTISPATLPAATQGAAYSQTVTAGGGTAPYTYAIVAGALPAGLALNASSGAISGTPTVNGAFNFTVQATDSTPNTGMRAYTLNVGTNSLVVNPASLPAGTKGVAYNQTLSASGGNGSYTYAIASGALPAGLALNVSTGAITGTPTGNGFSNFTVKATDTNGDTGSRAYALSIGTNSLIINPASLPAAVLGAPYNQIVTATGGTGPYTYAIIAGALPPGLAFNTSTGQITGTPTGQGSFSVTIQATDANGDIGSRAYAAFQVRPNPALDPDVQGLVAAQAATARQFAATQITNVGGHLEGLHDAFDPCMLNVGLGVTVVDPTTGLPTNDPNANPQAPRGNLPGTCAGRLATQFPLAFWTGGTAQFGTTSVNGSNNQFSSGGLTFGLDGRISNALIVGAAVGYGSDHTDVGTDGTLSIAHNADAMFYASYQPFDHIFFDAIAGYGALGFNNQRFDSFSGSMFAGTRGGSEWFGSITASTDFRTGALKVSPYLRADFMTATLQSYGEQGPSSLALTYGAVSFGSTGGVVGLRGSYDIPTSWGVLSPTGRLEFRHELDDGFNQAMFYSDLGAGQTYVLNEAEASQNLVTGMIGLRARAGTNLFAEFEYGATAGSNSTIMQTIRAAFRYAL
ncbi:MAG TPA: putative Ig domain-containing protein [Xanthobacteraceae bacterium]|nr:putative Ig domain-containing protein [Xanthobacteraceae bacterium]